MNKKLVYLAAPYSGTKSEMKTRFRIINLYAACVFKAGDYWVYSPISHTVPIAKAGHCGATFGFWEEFDLKMISLCDEVHVLCLPGVEKSEGVSAEIEYASRIGKPIKMVRIPTNS